MKDNFKDEFAIIFKHLNSNQKTDVLDYAKTLPKKKLAKDKSALLKFAGSISQKELRLIEKAIENDCENIDRNEW